MDILLDGDVGDVDLLLLVTEEMDPAFLIVLLLMALLPGSLKK